VKSFLVRAISIAVAASLLPVIVSSQERDTTVTIESGSYAGMVVPIAKGSATRKGSHLWRLSSREDKRVVGWNPSRFPIGVAFRPGNGISADDSIAFWRTLAQMERDVGAAIFSPAAVSADDDPDDVIVVGIRQMDRDDGVTFVTWSGNGSLYDARVYFSSAAKLHEQGVVMHEMMHALGFGHTSDAGSIMNSSPIGRAFESTRRCVRAARASVALRQRGVGHMGAPRSRG
jgi:Matrixin.